MKGPIILITMMMYLVEADKEIYSAHSQLETLYKNEGQLLNQLEIFLEDFHLNFDQINRKMTEIRKRRENMDVSKYFENPINSFKYLMSLTRLLGDFKKIISKPASALIKLVEDIEEADGWPTQKDVDGAARALSRLQSIYKLNMDDLIDGRIMDTKTTPLSCEEVLYFGEVGIFDYDSVEYTSIDIDQIYSWIEKAYFKCINSECSPAIQIKTTEYFAFIHYLLGDMKNSLKLTEEVLKHKPDHKRALINKMFLLDEVNDVPLPNRSGKYMKSPDGRYIFDRVYHFACQGFLKSSENVNLKCRYVHHNNPYLMIGPVKQEDVNIDPHVVLYKDILADSEIEELKEISRKNLIRSSVVDSTNSDSIRLSKVAWLDGRNGMVVSKVTRRFATYANLSYESCEMLQVANYGLGGHYVPHIDAFSEFSPWIGNRIGTLLVYMNHVEEGGHTVFTNLGLNVKPETGSAVFWYNLHRNGSIDMRTFHAGCPVLLGNKWAINLWFREAGNELRKPCPLDRYAS